MRRHSFTPLGRDQPGKDLCGHCGTYRWTLFRPCQRLMSIRSMLPVQLYGRWPDALQWAVQKPLCTRVGGSR